VITLFWTTLYDTCNDNMSNIPRTTFTSPQEGVEAETNFCDFRSVYVSCKRRVVHKLALRRLDVELLEV